MVNSVRFITVVLGCFKSTVRLLLDVVKQYLHSTCYMSRTLLNILYYVTTFSHHKIHEIRTVVNPFSKGKMESTRSKSRFGGQKTPAL